MNQSDNGNCHGQNIAKRQEFYRLLKPTE